MGKVSHNGMMTISYHYFDVKHLRFVIAFAHSLSTVHDMLQTKTATPELVECWCADSQVIPRPIHSPFDPSVL